MGRHAAPPPSSVANRPVPGRRTSTATAGFLVAGAGLALAGATVLGLTATGITLTPRAPVAAVAQPTPTPSVQTVAVTDSPAQKAVLAAAPFVPAPAPGWVSASDLAWTGHALRTPDVRPPEGRSRAVGHRIYGVGKQQLVAHSIGVRRGLRGRRVHPVGRAGRCGGPVSRTAASIGAVAAGSRTAATATAADAFVAWIKPTAGISPGASALFWRRGDVIAVLATPSLVKLTGLSAAAIGLDRVLLAALAGRCADITSTVADAARSPWASGDQFTGLTSPVRVSVTPSPIPSPPQGASRGRPRVDAVAAALDLLPGASRRARRGRVHWPAPVLSPSPPTAPQPARRGRWCRRGSPTRPARVAAGPSPARPSRR